MSISFSPPNAAKTKSMDTSSFVYEDEMSLIIPYPSSQSDTIGALFSPFQTKVEINNSNYTNELYIK